MIMNKMLALCMSPDQGGLELYFLKFARYYNNDNLFGDDKDNQIFGNDGNDVINSGKGNDIIDGGSGNDVAIFSSIKKQIFQEASIFYYSFLKWLLKVQYPELAKYSIYYK